jgi:hypothetical protein
VKSAFLGCDPVPVKESSFFCVVASGFFVTNLKKTAVFRALLINHFSSRGELLICSLLLSSLRDSG